RVGRGAAPGRRCLRLAGSGPVARRRAGRDLARECGQPSADPGLVAAPLASAPASARRSVKARGNAEELARKAEEKQKRKPPHSCIFLVIKQKAQREGSNVRFRWPAPACNPFQL